MKERNFSKGRNNWYGVMENRRKGKRKEKNIYM